MSVIAKENKERAQEFWAQLEKLFAGENIDLTRFISDDFEWTVPESMRGKLVGKEAAQQAFQSINSIYMPESTRFEFISWTAEDDRVALHFELEATVVSTGKPYKNYYLAQMRFYDGLMTEMFETFDTALTFRAFE